MTAVRAFRWPRSAWQVALAVGAGLLMAVNLYLAGRSIGLVLGAAPAVDWDQYVEAARRLTTGGELYAVTDTYAYHYSPLLAALFGIVAPLGTVGWRILHVVGALALPTWPMRLVTLTSWPLWYDVETGNLVIVVLLAAAWALTGSRLASGLFLVLAILIPRPLMIPVAVWLLWKRPEWRFRFAAAFAVHAVAVLAMGWGADWIGALIAAGGDVGIPSNVGPSRFVGVMPWLVIGIPLAAWLTIHGRVGLASLAASPYWLPYYLLMPVLELSRRREASERPERRAAQP